MRRRGVLATAFGTIVTAGCVSQPDADDPSAGGSDTTANGGAERRLVVERVETPTDAIRLNDLGTGPIGEVPSVASLSDRRRRVVESAVDDGYQTDDLPDWLVTFAAETPYVRRDGTYYRLDHDLPRYELTAQETTESAVEGSIADTETYREAVTHDGVVSSALLRHARREGVTLVDPWPSLVAFVRRYDAVRYRESLLSLSWTVRDDGPPYTVTAERVAPTELADGPVYDASEATDRVRAVVRAAGEAEGVYAGDVPDRLLDAIAAHRYVYLDGTFYWAGVENRGDLPVRFEVSVVNAGVAGSDEPRIRLALVNESDQTAGVLSGAPPPFGVVFLERPADEARVLLWNDAYRESSHVGTEGRSVTFVEGLGVVTDLAGGDRAERTFTVVGDLSPGEYRLRGEVSVETDRENGGTLPYRVSVRVVEE